MTHTISLLEGEVVKFKMNVKKHTEETGLLHVAKYYEELQTEYEKAIEVLKIYVKPDVSGQLPPFDLPNDCVQSFQCEYPIGTCKKCWR